MEIWCLVAIFSSPQSHQIEIDKYTEDETDNEIQRT